MSTVHDTRTFNYGGLQVKMRYRSGGVKTIELPILEMAKLGLKVSTSKHDVSIKPLGCEHKHRSYIGQFMVDAYDCDDCGNRSYE